MLDLIDHDFENLQLLYSQLYQQIDTVLDQYGEIIKSNRVTKEFLNLGYEEKEAYTMSFLMTLLIYKKIELDS